MIQQGYLARLFKLSLLVAGNGAMAPASWDTKAMLGSLATTDQRPSFPAIHHFSLMLHKSAIGSGSAPEFERRRVQRFGIARAGSLSNDIRFIRLTPTGGAHGAEQHLSPYP